MNKPTPDEQAGEAAAERLGEQTPVYPVTKVTRRKAPKILIEPSPKGRRVVYSPAQLYTLYAAKALLLESDTHADDGSNDLAAVAASQMHTFLRRYPVDWVDPTPKPKPK